eukprot:CAMPEP_0182429546 /NCGR_PEP_ID=MMETSP1167-20130531/30449_1 /TAXON_ID=2988 /ORGANISM="Mallomonas Sp, Strain CCMP3275" /LENGTH=150 /DNA_ID=CAMNT_0024613361 /DNA_START=63 /DNA_END=511 /DNA_ORIENTATION=+
MSLTRFNTAPQGILSRNSDLFDPNAIMRDFFEPMTTLSTRQGMGPFTDVARTGILMDMVETPTAFELHADLPGLKKEDIDVHIVDRRLTLTGSRSEEHVEDTDTFYRRERFAGKVQRTLTLPPNADIDKSEAKFENGVLTLKFMKHVGEA